MTDNTELVARLRELKHTPGPWRVVGYPYYQYWITNEPPDNRGHVKVIASIEHQGYAEKPYFDAGAREGNAKLMALAPEMRDALEAQGRRLAEAEAEIARADYATRRAVERLAEAENDAEAAHAMLAEVSRLTGKRIGESVPESVERIAARLAEAERKVMDAMELLAEQERKTNRALNDKTEINARLAEAEAHAANDRLVVEEAQRRLVEAEVLLREAREPVWIISTLREAGVLQSRDRDRLKALVARIDAFLTPPPAPNKEAK